jgi:hypothetical protein
MATQAAAGRSRPDLVTSALLVLGVGFGLLTLIGSAYYAFGMDSDSESLFRLAQAACFTTEGAESVERCAPLTRATVEGELLTFFSPLGFISWLAVLVVAGLCLWLLIDRRNPVAGGSQLPRWTAWVFVGCCTWLLLAPLDKLWDEEYGEGISTPTTGVLSQYLPAVVGQSSGRVWLGSSDATYAAVGRLLGQAFILWVVAMLVVSIQARMRARSGS